MQTDTLARDSATTDTFPINGTDFVEFYVGNAKQASHYYRSAFGYRAGGVPRARDRHPGPRQLSAPAEQGPAGPHDTALARSSDRGARPLARRRRAGHRALGGRCAAGVRSSRSSGARGRHRSPPCCGMSTARWSSRRSIPTVTPSTVWWSGGTTRAPSCPGFQPVTRRSLRPGGTAVRRPLRRQRRAGGDEPVGQVLSRT